MSVLASPPQNALAPGTPALYLRRSDKIARRAHTWLIWTVGLGLALFTTWAALTSLERITRNTAIYCAVFDEESPLDVITIYEVPVDVVLRETERQLDASRNEISHVGFTIKWAQQNGKVAYTKQA